MERPFEAKIEHVFLGAGPSVSDKRQAYAPSSLGGAGSVPCLLPGSFFDIEHLSVWLGQQA